jgi:hypothetical protein
MSGWGNTHLFYAPIGRKPRFVEIVSKSESNPNGLWRGTSSLRTRPVIQGEQPLALTGFLLGAVLQCDQCSGGTGWCVSATLKGLLPRCKTALHTTYGSQRNSVSVRQAWWRKTPYAQVL